jgi:hypothetical protein
MELTVDYDPVLLDGPNPYSFRKFAAPILRYFRLTHSCRSVSSLALRFAPVTRLRDDGEPRPAITVAAEVL